ncbi:MAG: diaminopimelate decarboxylase [Eggerthellaceae bacterium]|nr:diaminopimelate decarboxylase [Eggerthellaceae bacterium]
MNDEKLMDIAREFGTPAFVFDEADLHARVAFLRENLPARATLCFAVKANPFAIPLISSEVHRFEVCSPGELNICRAVGVAPEEVVLSGVYKDEATLRPLIEVGAPIHRYTVESFGQFQLLYRLAKEFDRRLPLLLRVTTGTQFGMDESVVRQIIADYGTDPAVDICGLQVFSGTQKTKARRTAKELAAADALIAALREDYGFEVREFEFGPGLPVEYFDDYDEAGERALLAEVSALLEGMAFQGPLTLEIGRSLVASCGSYITGVVDTKTNKGENYAIVDGGKHQMVYYGGGLVMRQPPCRQLGRGDCEEGAQPWNICGSLCTTNDFLAKGVPAVDLAPGDVIAFDRTGAYCMTEGISLFLSRDLPKVVFARADGTCQLVREGIPTDPFNTPKNFSGKGNL